jgi:diguanylate cyclase (GGDEF)-like protein
MGIPEAEFTPKVRAAIMALMEEVAALRRELAQTSQRIQHLERLADQDTLAPVANRRAFVRELSRQMSYAERYGAPSAVVYFDVDGMKQINDAHGHGAGDAALTHVARLIAGNIRESDIAGRLGGDEFGLILAHADQALANEKAADLARLIGETPFEWQGHKLRLSVSYGAHAFMGGGDPAVALDAADKQMYARKRGAVKAG